MGRFQRSWCLAKQSYGVLRSNPSLVAFPIISAAITIALSASFVVPMYLIFGKDVTEPSQVPPLAYVGLFLFYLASYFVVIFFNSGLIFCANETMAGRPASLSDGLHAASRRTPQILGWALVSATIGMIFRFISERTGIIGQIVVGLVGAAWNIATFFVVPSLVLEGLGPWAATKESWAAIKKTWGESLIGTGGIGLAMMLLTLPPIGLIVGAAFTSSVAIIIAAVVISILYWLVLAAVGASMQGIYTTAVYCYAKNGMVMSGFDSELIQSAFTSKPNKMLDRFRKR